jgi:hypothetical protein
MPISLHKIENNLEFLALDKMKFTTLTASVRTVFKIAEIFLAARAGVSNTRPAGSFYAALALILL